MSLINNMLQDLQRRRGQNAVQPADPLAHIATDYSATTPTQKRMLMRYLQLLLLFILGAAISYTLWDRQQPQPIEQTATHKESQSVGVGQTLAEVSKQSHEPVVQLSRSAAVIQDNVAEKPVYVAKQHKQPKVLSANKITTAKETSGAVLRVASQDKRKTAQVQSVQAQVKPDQKKIEQAAAGIIKRVRPLNPVQRSALAYGKAMKQLRQGRQVEAIKALKSAIKDQPKHLQARQTLAAVLLNSGRLSEAEAVLHDGLRLHAKASVLAKLYARLIVNRGDTLKAVVVLEGAKPRVESDPEYYALLAAFYQRLSRHAQAIETYRQVLRIKPDHGIWWLGLGISLEAEGHVHQALLAFRRARVSKGLRAEVTRFITERIQALSVLDSNSG